MTNLLVPKVTLAESAGSLGIPQNNQVVIGIIGVSEQGTANVVNTIYSTSQAESVFGSNTCHGADLVKMINRAFQEGASVIKAVSIGQPDIDAATNASQGVLTADAEAGVYAVEVADATIYTAGDVVYLGNNLAYDKEERFIVDTGVSTTLTFTTPLTFKHYAGEDAKIITPKSTGSGGGSSSVSSSPSTSASTSASPSSAPNTANDYTLAIAAMELEETKSIVLCDLNDDNIAELLVEMCENSTVNNNSPCIYLRAPHFEVALADYEANAQTLNSDRVVQVYPNLTDFNGKTLNPGETAAVVAGAIALNGVPWPNHNLTSFSSVGGVATQITDMDELIAAGVSPLELRHDTIHIVRLVTTYTVLNGAPSYLWQEAAVRLNVDYIERVLAKDVQDKFLQKGVNPQTLLALKQEVTAFLNQFASSNILVADTVHGVPAYKTPVVTVDPDDTTSVTVEIEISPGKPLNFVNLKFSVNL